MLVKFQPFISDFLAIVGAAMSALVAAAVAATETSTTVVVHEGDTTVIHQIVIMDDERMRMICIVGALAGGVLCSILFAGREPTARTLVTKIIASTGLGIIGTPALFHYMNWSPTTDTLLFASSVVALVGVGVVKTVVPLWEKYIASKVSPPTTP